MEEHSESHWALKRSTVIVPFYLFRVFTLNICCSSKREEYFDDTTF